MNIYKIRKESNTLLNKEVNLQGWVRFNRVSKNIGFLDIFDGTDSNSIQAVYKIENADLFEKMSKLTLYSAIDINGTLVQGKNDLEINVTKVNSISLSAEEHPLGKKEHSFEYLREIANIRPKTKTFQAIFRIRSTAFNSINKFFEQNGFLNVQTPIFTSNDAEAAGETFIVKTKKNEDFFSNQASLTVSGQLHAEAFAQAFKKVFTFGPTFRAENSNTQKHVSEFWMLEPEVTFCDYHQMMKIVFDMLKYVVSQVIEKNSRDLMILDEINKTHQLEELKSFSMSSLKKITYEEAINILNKAQQLGHKFDNSNIKFGIDLATEHEKYLAGEYAKGPIFVYDYPVEIKSFYMYKNDDNKTVRGFDYLVPQIGELVGGSQREDNYDKLKKAMNEKGVEIAGLEWYLNMRREGYAPSTGFGLGFERLIMFLTGTENIKDTIAFPRAPGKLLY